MPWPATSFLGQLSETTRQAALHLGTLRHLAAGEIVIQEGDRPAFAVVLLSGVRFIGSIRRELLDRTLIFNQRHTTTVLGEYHHHYNSHRPHRTLGHATPRRPLP